MKKHFFYLIMVVICLPLWITAQIKSKLVSGPWAGNVELRTAMIWLEVSADVKKVAVEYCPSTSLNSKKSVAYKGELGKSFNPIKLELNDLEFGTTYQYAVVIDGKKIDLPFDTRFTTKDLWQYRKPAPDFSFLTGSCAYFNEAKFDRPGKPYGGDSSIFETMAKTPADFNIWLGDNWYYREVDYSSVWGLKYRASHDRAIPILQKLMASMPQYAIWDDHDFGPNDAGENYIFKNESRTIFNDYWLNPTSGENKEGIYTMMNYGDVDFFLLDNRFFRSDINLADTINNIVNEDKAYFGKSQLEWLKNSLLFSRATFKIIVTGNQVLNPINNYECLTHYPTEYKALIDFLSNQKINGVVFLTGDRHHSEVIEMQRPNDYPLYDITISPLTSGVGKVSGKELDNPFRVANTLIEAQNFGKISFFGSKGNRTMKVDFIGKNGEQLGNWIVEENKLKVRN
jgi:alkaline phosphatase D